MKTLLAVSLLCALSVACGPSAQEKKAKSPECLAAKNKAAERQAQARLVDAEIRARDQTKRRELTNLRLDDQIARLEGRPIKNLNAEALFESSFSIDEIGLEHAPEMESLSISIDQYMIQAACEMPPAKQN